MYEGHWGNWQNSGNSSKIMIRAEDDTYDARARTKGGSATDTTSSMRLDLHLTGGLLVEITNETNVSINAKQHVLNDNSRLGAFHV
jgi:hypothetical protein